LPSQKPPNQDDPIAVLERKQDEDVISFDQLRSLDEPSEDERSRMERLSQQIENRTNEIKRISDARQKQHAAAQQGVEPDVE
jgi:hypothetical protein